MSLLRYVPNGVSRIAGRTMLKTSQHSPTILFAAGVIGVVATAVVASRATLKLEAILDESQTKRNQAELLRSQDREDYTQEDYVKDVAVIYTRTTMEIAKVYGPAIVLGVFTIAALTGSHHILTKRNTALTMAYAALDRGFREYRQRVVNEYGESVDRRMRYDTEVHKITVDDNGKSKELEVYRATKENDYSIYARFFDQLCQSFSPTPEYNRIFLSGQQAWFNNRLRARGHVFLNEVYDALGFERSQAGQVVGWLYNSDGDNFIDFGIYDDKRERARDFVNGREGAILLDFNVDGVIYDKI
jgi:Family of unknown function (DUF6353)